MCRLCKTYKGVILYRCNRNIARCYRLCYTFGVKTLYLWDCTHEIKWGNLFSAKGNVNVVRIGSANEIPEDTVILEKWGDEPINGCFMDYENILIGGENVTIPKALHERFLSMHIPTVNSLCLTTDEALAVGLAYAAS